MKKTIDPLSNCAESLACFGNFGYYFLPLVDSRNSVDDFRHFNDELLRAARHQRKETLFNNLKRCKTLGDGEPEEIGKGVREAGMSTLIAFFFLVALR